MNYPELLSYIFPANQKEITAILEGADLPNDVQYTVKVIDFVGEIVFSFSDESTSKMLRSKVEELFGDNLFSFDSFKLERAVLKLLTKNKNTLAVAESCTGGLVSKKITDIGGASKVFLGSVTSYANEVKEDVLGIAEAVIEENGAVSKEVALEMARRVRILMKSDFGIGITGVAGPSGGTPTKPVGTVYVALATANGSWVQRLDLGEHKSRDDIRNETSLFALFMLVQALRGSETFKQYFVPDPVKETKKPGIFRRIFRFLFPTKDDTIGEKLRKAGFLFFMVVFIVSGVLVSRYFIEKLKGDNINKETVEALEKPPSEEDIANLPDGYLEKFATLYKINPEIAGWLKAGDINLPVVHAKDNTKYLKMNFYQQQHDFGVPFMDWRNRVKPLNTNTVIYGHNIRPDRIFASLLNYKNLNYYRQNPVVSFDTVYAEMKWKIFAIIYTDSEQSRGDVFDYHNFIDSHGSDHFNNYILNLRRRSLINTTVDVNTSDRLLTLSTCGFDFQGQRFAIICRMLRPGESEEVDTAGATVNPMPLMPNFWYQFYNRTRPEFPWESAGENNSSSATPNSPDPWNTPSNESHSQAVESNHSSGDSETGNENSNSQSGSAPDE